MCCSTITVTAILLSSILDIPPAMCGRSYWLYMHEVMQAMQEAYDVLADTATLREPVS
jgi:hypothetical protein